MENKRVLILGAGVYQKPLILKVKEMGHQALVVSPQGSYPGIAHADVFFDVDTTDTESVLKIAKSHRIHAIVTTGTDVCMPTLGKVVDVLNLTGVSYDAALKCMDKSIMKEAFKEYDVPTARFQTFSCGPEALIYAEILGFPIMVKASDSSGSRGVYKVETSDLFESSFNSALKVSRNKQIIVEEFLDGIEFGAQAFISNGELRKLVLHGDIVNKGEITTPIGHFLPLNLEDDLVYKINEVVKNAVTSLKIDNCVSNIDFMLVNNEPKIIEIGARMGATCLPENMSIFYDEDIYAYMINLALGNNPIFHWRDSRANTSLLLTSKTSGILKSIEIPETVTNHPNLIQLVIDVNVGDHVNAFSVGPDRLGHIITSGNTAEEATRLANELAAHIVFNL